MQTALQTLFVLLLSATAVPAQVLQITEINDWDSAVRGTGDAPALHAGTVAFYGYEVQGSVTGVYTSPATGGGVFTPIAQVGDPVPNNPGRTFGSVSNPSIYGGTVAFTGGWGSDPDGLYLGDGGPLTVVVDFLAGEPRPRFPFLGPDGVTFEAKDAYETPYHRPLPTGVPMPIATRGQAAPGGGTFSTFSLNRRGPAFGGGIAAFTAYVSHPADTTAALYTFDAATGQLDLVANWNTAMPGQSFNFDHIGYHDTDGESVAFEGKNGYLNFGGHTGVYLAPVGAGGQGPLTVIAERGDPAPGINASFSSFGHVAVQDGLVVFEAYLGSAQGLYGWRDGALFEIIDSTDPLFGEDTIDFVMSNRGLDHNQLAFRARWHDPNGAYGAGYGVYVATLAGGITLSGPTTLTPGTTVDLDVVGAQPGELVHYVSSLNGMGEGRSRRGATLDLLDPLRVLGSAAADANGEATLPAVVPLNAPLGTEVAIQTVVFRGQTDSITSNALAAVIE